MCTVEYNSHSHKKCQVCMTDYDVRTVCYDRSKIALNRKKNHDTRIFAT